MKNDTDRGLLQALFVTTLIVSNIIAVKIGSFGGVFLPVAVVIFPISYILGDVITEVYGFSTMRRTIWIGFACNLLAVAAIALGQWIPAAPFFDAQGAYERILGWTPRILAASFIAYLVGEFVNAAILTKLKAKTKGRHLWLRTISSTLIGEGLDSFLFLSIAFAGSMPISQLHALILAQWGFKVSFEILATPFTYAAVASLKRRAGLSFHQ